VIQRRSSLSDQVMRSVLPVCMLFIALAAVASRASAQQCVARTQPSFEFQVDQPAVYRGDTAVVPRPDARSRFMRSSDHPEAMLVQFVVDTLGVPDMRSFHVLRSLSRTSADSVRAAVPAWRFTSAVRDGCKVAQLIQTFVTH